jgi:hypothetical protein
MLRDHEGIESYLQHLDLEVLSGLVLVFSNLTYGRGLTALLRLGWWGGAGQ